MDIAGAIRETLRATAEYFGWKRDKANRENVADVRAAEVGNDQAQLKDKVADELEAEDLDAVRRRNSSE